MVSIGQLPLELFHMIVDQLVTDNGVGATCVLRLVSRYFNSNILDNVLTPQPPEAFRNPDALAVLVNNLDRFVPVMSRNENTRGFDDTFVKKVNTFMEFLMSYVAFTRRADVYPGALKKLCLGLSMILGKENISRAIITTGLQPSASQLHHLQRWWTAFNDTRNTSESVELAVAMSAQSETLTHNLLARLPDDLTNIRVNEVFGNPLINVIKLQDVSMLAIIVQHVEARINKLTMPPELPGHFSRMAWFPIEAAVGMAISYNQSAMVPTLLKLHHKQFGRPSKANFSGWMDSAIRVDKISMVHELYKGHLPKPFELNPRTIAELCRTGNYDMVTACVSPLVQNIQHTAFRHNPIHIAVLYRNCGAVRALHDMGKVDINQLATHHKSSVHYHREKVAPIDIACLNRDIRMLKVLLRKGANFRRRFAVTLSGQAYYTIRDWAMKPENGGFTHMPEYGVYNCKLQEDQVDTVIG